MAFEASLVLFRNGLPVGIQHTDKPCEKYKEQCAKEKFHGTGKLEKLPRKHNTTGAGFDFITYFKDLM